MYTTPFFFFFFWNTTPHNRNVNTNSKGLILDNMTWSATQFNVPMVTAGFLTALLKTMWQVWLYTCPHTHTHKSTLHLQKGRGGGGTVAFFSLLLNLPFWASMYTQTRAHSHRQRSRHSKDYTVMCWSSLMWKSPLSLPSSLSCIITLSIDPLTVQVHVAGGEEQWRSPPLGRRRIWGSGKGGGEVWECCVRGVEDKRTLLGWGSYLFLMIGCGITVSTFSSGAVEVNHRIKTTPSC